MRTMDINTILQAQEEAEKFIESVQELLEDRAKNNQKGDYAHGMHAATVKRKSMDLTRTLSKMRQGK